jgi:DNA-binding GntR family transcriptional regulator
MKKTIPLVDNAYRKIREAISKNQLSPGERLAETKMAHIFNVTRTPFREAMQRLEAEGYVASEPNKGYSVRNISSKDATQIYSMIAVLEGLAVELTIRRTDKWDIDILLSLHRLLIKDAKTLDIYSWLEHNAQFHGFFASQSMNSHLQKNISDLRNQVYRYRYTGSLIPNQMKEYVVAHTKLIAAVQQGKPTLARKIMENHVNHFNKVLCDLLTEHFPVP